jgi:hypothetical protein
MTPRWAVRRYLLACGILCADKAMQEIFGALTIVSSQSQRKPGLLSQGLESFLSATPSRETQLTACATQNACPATPQRRTYAGRLHVQLARSLVGRHCVWIQRSHAREAPSLPRLQQSTTRFSPCPLGARPTSSWRTSFDCRLAQLPVSTAASRSHKSMPYRQGLGNACREGSL